MAGITSSGFVPKVLTEIQAELEAAYKEKYGESIALHAQSRLGQHIGILSERYADLWEALEAVYAAATVDGAEGANLDALCALTGTIREAATKSEVTGTATGTPGTVLNSGRVMSVVTVGTKFQTTAGATIVAATAWASSTVYVAGDRRTNGGNIYLCVTGGTSDGSGGPTGTGTSITDNTVTWRYIGGGTGYVDVACEAQETGPKTALAYTLTTIETPVGGWSSFTNLLDAELGTDEETDAALRLRRESELRSGGLAAQEPVRQAVLKVEDVTACTVFQNDTDVTDGDGVPPHSIEVLVSGGDEDEIRAAIFASAAAGIRTHGSTSGTVTDASGVSHTVKFSRPTEIDIWIRVDIITQASVFPSDGVTKVKEAVVNYGNTFSNGKDAVSASLGAQAFTVAGVLDTPLVYIGTSNPATASTTIVITSRQLAKYDTSRVTVNVSTGSP